ncbi:MAG: peroxiredoxin [Gammaproteobacteria bacterium]|nr:peroxiredoxin [Gammaproteobacteria bacterium]MDE2345990.1 peroxiredoxin [Gammaproteobacteria bacterium]
MLKLGDLAPDFELPDQFNRNQRLSSLLQRGALILYFYPADFTPVCTREACAFRELQPTLAAGGIGIAGVSPQNSDSHARFSALYKLDFPLLADPEKRVIRAYGCNGVMGFGLKRASFLIGRDRRIMETAHAALRLSPHILLGKRALGKSHTR